MTNISRDLADTLTANSRVTPMTHPQITSMMPPQRLLASKKQTNPALIPIKESSFTPPAETHPARLCETYSFPFDGSKWGQKFYDTTLPSRGNSKWDGWKRYLRSARGMPCIMATVSAVFGFLFGKHSTKAFLIQATLAFLLLLAAWPLTPNPFVDLKHRPKRRCDKLHIGYWQRRWCNLYLDFEKKKRCVVLHGKKLEWILYASISTETVWLGVFCSALISLSSWMHHPQYDIVDKARLPPINGKAVLIYVVAWVALEVAVRRIHKLLVKRYLSFNCDCSWTYSK